MHFKLVIDDEEILAFHEKALKTFSIYLTQKQTKGSEEEWKSIFILQQAAVLPLLC